MSDFVKGMAPMESFVNYYCTNRVKPKLLRDVKTEALLVFARTALERYFTQIDEMGYEPVLGSQEDTDYVYKTLRTLLTQMQRSVVNVDYLIHVTQGAKQDPKLKALFAYEEPLIHYYDVMAQRVAAYYADKKAYLPEFLVICVLANWVLEEQKSTAYYPFLEEIDYLELISKFEVHREYFENQSGCTISEIHELSLLITDQLKKKKYKLNKARASKTRKKK